MEHRQGDTGRRLSDAERLEIRRLVRSGEPYRVAAAAVGTTPKTIGLLMRTLANAVRRKSPDSRSLDERANDHCKASMLSTRRLLVCVVAAVVLSAAAVAGCSEADELLLINRSGRPIACAPGVTVGPCEQVAMTRAQITAADDRRSEAIVGGEEWAPAGAVRFERGLAGAPVGAPDPMVVVFSSEAEPQVAHGAVPPDLPACAGDPMGIE